MAVSGKKIGGVFGFLFGGGPVGAVLGVALGAYADQRGFKGWQLPRLPGLPSLDGLRQAVPLAPLRLAAMLGQKEQVFSIAVIALAAKVARVDGPVKRSEIDAFKRLFRVPPEALREVGRLFDQARENPEEFAPFAMHLAESFADHDGVREDVLAGLFAIARADGAANEAELQMLQEIARLLRLSAASFRRASEGRARSSGDEEDPYAVLGVGREDGDVEIRLAWKKLMRENHPDSLASRGVPQEFIDSAHHKVARINAAWDRVKRERGI